MFWGRYKGSGPMRYLAYKQNYAETFFMGSPSAAWRFYIENGILTLYLSFLGATPSIGSKTAQIPEKTK